MVLPKVLALAGLLAAMAPSRRAAEVALVVGANDVTNLTLSMTQRTGKNWHEVTSTRQRDAQPSQESRKTGKSSPAAARQAGSAGASVNWLLYRA